MRFNYKCSHLLFLSFLGLLFLPQVTKACVQPHDSVLVTVHYETPGSTDISLTISNLRLAAGTPNEFCSCGITSFTNVFSSILYVAFVDSGTTNPVPGFDVWDPSAAAGNAWNNVVATGDWSAFVSHVNGSGLNFGNPVELIIRAQLAPGYTYTFVDSALYVSYLGTDAYDNVNQVLGNMHQDVSGFEAPHTLIPEGPGSTYFADLDAALMVSIAIPGPSYSFDIYPIPASDRILVNVTDPQSSIRAIEVFDATGRLLIHEDELKSKQETIDLASLPSGAYFIKVNTPNGIQTRKFLKSE